MEQACRCSSVRVLTATLRCVVDANCLPAWLALARHACRQRLRPSSLLCTRAVRGLRPLEQGCGCSSVRALAATLRYEGNANCLAGWLAFARDACRQWLRPSSLLCTGAVRALRPIEQGCGCSLVRVLAAALRCEVDANCLPACPALARHACRQRLRPSSLLCTGAARGLRPIEQGCGCSSGRVLVPASRC